LLRDAGPVGNILFGDLAHGVGDRNMRDALRLIDPAGAVQSRHLLFVELRHVGGRLLLQSRLGIVRQRQAHRSVGRGAGKEHEDDEGHQRHGHHQDARAAPYEGRGDVRGLVLRRFEGLLRHDASLS
jgi:hypothetical protein